MDKEQAIREMRELDKVLFPHNLTEKIDFFLWRRNLFLWRLKHWNWNRLVQDKKEV